MQFDLILNQKSEGAAGMRMIIAVGIGGAVGTLLRFGVAQAFNDPVFPFGTLIANWTGCLGLAWLNEQTKTAFSPVWQKGLGTGLLGAYTTFSTLCVETHLLPPLLSLFYIVVTATGGLLFAAWGFGWPKGGKPVGNDVDCFGRGIGAICRWLVTEAFPARDGKFPLGTFLVNMTGCFIMGLYLGWVHDRLPVAWMMANRPFVAGFLGGYTTFSTFSYEAERLRQQKRKEILGLSPLQPFPRFVFGLVRFSHLLRHGFVKNSMVQAQASHGVFLWESFYAV